MRNADHDDDRRIDRTDPAHPGTGRLTFYCYDDGTLTRIIGPRGHATANGDDVEPRPARIIDAPCQTTTYSYHDDGTLADITGPDGNTAPPRRS